MEAINVTSHSAVVYRNWRDLIRPRALERDGHISTVNYGKFSCEPLERGFGITLGNSLRRVLLSSLQGAAITSIKIDGALHEFTSVPGVKEDVTDLILNLKEVMLRMSDPGPRILVIDKRGPGEVTASDIEGSDSVKILNPNHHIATLSDDAKLRIEMTAEMGRGYVPAEYNKESQLGVGAIPIDALFSPVRKVNYTVANARVGQQTDYDRLMFEVWTDGSVTPDDAIAFAAKILKDQLTIFINFDEVEEPEEESSGDEDQKVLFEHLNRTVDELELSVRSANCLQNANIRFIGQLVQKSEGEMLKTKNFGRKSLKEIREILSTMGLSLGMKIDGWKEPAPQALSDIEDEEGDMEGDDVDDDDDI